MDLTHKLTYKTGTHTEHHEEYGEEYGFSYETWQGTTMYPWNQTYPYVLKIDGSAYRLQSPTDGDLHETNISKPISLNKGTYKAIVPENCDALRLFKISAYSAGEEATRIGTYHNGDIIELEDESSLYIIEDIELNKFNDLSCSMIEYNEYDEEVIDYSTVVINEPIGFDDLQSTIKRHEYHGMGAEVSLGNLEFYGAAADIIANAYAEDIDSKVQYEVSAGNEIIYSGQLDLSTYSLQESDYRSVSVKVGEIGAKTTFNNRTDKEVDVDDPKTIDGLAVESPTWLPIEIPIKHLLYTNILELDEDIQTSERLTPGQYYYSFGGHFALSLGEKITEFGSIASKFVSFESGQPVPTGLATPFYLEPADFEDNFGANTTKHIEGNIKINLSGTVTANSDGLLQIEFFIYAKNGSSFTQMVRRDIGRVYAEGGVVTNFDIDSVINFGDGVYDQHEAQGSNFYAAITITDNSREVTEVNIAVKIKSGSFIKMTMYDNLDDNLVEAPMLLVYDALEVVSQAISENALHVASDWYQKRTPRLQSWGGGALKALTNGYKIRGLFTDENNKRNMPLSFKSLIESLSALDCIGWGFSTENGDTVVRVERWDWFYKDTVVLTLSNVSEVTIEVNPDNIPTELKIGYKKYATQEQYNSIDSPHGTRSFINGIKAVNKAITKESEFIADNYAIEETRRAKTKINETEESTYDENIFVFELTRGLELAKAATDAQHVGRASEFINALLTPRNMAARWRNFLFSTNNSTPFKFTTGEINYKASFGIDPNETGLENFAITDPQAENDDITYTPAKFMAEKITFSCPITIAQYRAVKANPYGLVSVNGRYGWIMDFKYKFEDGMADFTLIAKNTNNS